MSEAHQYGVRSAAWHRQETTEFEGKQGGVGVRIMAIVVFC